MQVEKLSGNPKPLDILAKINQIIDNMVVSVNGSGTDGNGNINVAIIPVGTIYVQFAGQTDPTTLFGGTWENISAQFAGKFFRCEGGNAAAFGSSQNGGAPNIGGYLDAGRSYMTDYNTGTGALRGARSVQTDWGGSGSGNAVTGSAFSFNASWSNGAYNLNEFRPANYTIRIWKRTE